MCATLTCLAIAFVGVDIGYRPAPQGGLEYIVQIDPKTLSTLVPGDKFELEVRREAQQARASQITLTLGSGPLPHILPPPDSASPATAPFRSAPPAGEAPFRSAPPGVSVAPATAPIVPASPLPSSPVTPATAAMPLSSPAAPSLASPSGEEPVHVAPPSGPAIAPATAGESNESPQANGQAGSGRFGGLSPVGGDGSVPAPVEKPWLAMCLALIALCATNGYVGWLFWDARQRYIGLVARAFAPAN